MTGPEIDLRLVSKYPSVKTEDLAALSLGELQSLLEAQKEYNRSLPGDKTLRSFFAALSDEELLKYVALLQTRLERETELLERFTRLGLDPFAADLMDLPLQFPLLTADDAADGCTLTDGAQACYRGGAIYLASPPPPLAERLTLLACRGIIGNDVFHEVFHGLQDGVELFHSLEDVLNTAALGDDQAKVALAEAHAWLRCLPGFRHEVLMDVIGASYNIERREHLQVAFELLYSLVVLGLSDEEIGRLVGHARWCEKKQSYLELEQARARLLAANGLSPADLAEAVERSKVIERLQAVRAIGIARELVQAYRQAAVAVK